MKVKTALYVYHSQYAWQDQGKYEAYTFKLEENEENTFIGEQEVDLEVPDNYDPRARQIAALEKKKLKAMADYQKMVTDINEKISKLQALEHTA
jgi:hypothetical protein